MPPADATARLQAYDWNLNAAYDAQGQAAPGWRLDGRTALRMHFEGERVSVRNLCNLLGAAYTLVGDRMEISHLISTKRWCVDQAVMALERHVEEALPTVQRFDLRGGATPRLALHFADGGRWELAGMPTPATQYGSAGERIFLEVAPQRVACSSGAAQDAQCLRVREIRYGDNGVKQGTGEWRVFHGEIEGYTHEPGISNILRVNRFKRQNAPADASDYAYVLDLVVESRRVSE